jgi:hypothetical protein
MTMGYTFDEAAWLGEIVGTDTVIASYKVCNRIVVIMGCN